MSQIINFSAGPAALPQAVLVKIQQDLLDWQGTGSSVMEVSHRGSAFLAMAQQTESDLRQLLAIPDTYKVLFLQGGATTQFSAIPLNLSASKDLACYALTGHWSKKAIQDAQRFVGVELACDTTDTQYTDVVDMSDWRINPNAAYLHITPNETIAGVEFAELPKTSLPIVADMSSTLLSRDIDVSNYGLIYAGAQKNIGPAGLTIVIVREDLLGNFPADAPRLLDYKVMADTQSMSNTPPTFAWYVAGLVFRWLLDNGGVSAQEARNIQKADLLYSFIDASDGFYRNPVQSKYRSRMNVPFLLADDDLQGSFLQQAEESGLVGLKGHRSVGGMRASIYNAMPLSGVEVLIDFMRDFQHANN